MNTLILFKTSLESRIPSWFDHYTDFLERYKLQNTILDVLTLWSPSLALPKYLQAVCPQKNVLITTTKPKPVAVQLDHPCLGRANHPCCTTVPLELNFIVYTLLHIPYRIYRGSWRSMCVLSATLQ